MYCKPLILSPIQCNLDLLHPFNVLSSIHDIDLWSGEKALMEVFRDLYGIACAKDAFVAVHLELYGGSNQWNVSFVRAAHDWKVDVFALFFNLLYSLRVRREGEDKLCWIPSKKGFVVSSFYNILACNGDISFS